MKNFYSFAIATFIYLNASCAFAQLKEVNKLDDETETLSNIAARHMINFILTQCEFEYNFAMQNISVADEMNNHLINKSANLIGVNKRIQEFILEDRMREFEGYYAENLKQSILNEEAKDRNILINFRGKSYKLSAKSKELFDFFIAYLPRN